MSKKKLLHPDYYYFPLPQKTNLWKKLKIWKKNSNMFTNNIYLVLKLLGVLWYTLESGQQAALSSGTGFVAGRRFVCLFVCLFVVCEEGGVTHITWQSFFFIMQGLARNKYLAHSWPTRSPRYKPMRLPNPGYTGSRPRIMVN